MSILFCGNIIILFIYMVIGNKPEDVELIKVNNTNLTLENNKTAKILAGTTCSTADYPFFVSVRQGKHGASICGGSLVKSRWVLTAAHCLQYRQRYDVVAGYSNSDERQVSKIQKFYRHPNFSQDHYLNDIALAYLKTPLHKGENVGFVQLPKSHHRGLIFTVCDTAIIMGLGSLSPVLNLLPFQLQCAVVRIFPRPLCEFVYRRLLPGALCTKNDMVYRSDSCKGDSGGPLLCNGVQMGIVSWGIICGEETQPGIYTRVDEYLDFIHKTISKGSSPALQLGSKTTFIKFKNSFMFYLFTTAIVLIL